MAFTSFSFLVFLTVVIVLYYIVPKKFQWLLLLIASYAFYLFSGIKQVDSFSKIKLVDLLDGIKPVAFIIATTLITYFAALIMQNMRDEHRAKVASTEGLTKEQKREMKKAVSDKIHKVQVAAVAIDLLILIVVKYLNFGIGNINSLLGLFAYDKQLPLLNIIVPLGISFYTFASMGYLIDVGRGKYDAERHLGKFALFVSFFPSVVQGPINRFDDVGKQLGQEHKLDYYNLTYGAQLILWGFFKKMVIADRVAPIVSTYYSADYASYSGTELFICMLAYAAQIYCDFAGGIDIARGAAEMMGIRMPRNFERPYFSQSVAEYWRRWHITLGAWMREYVFYPIMLSKPITKLSKKARERHGNYAARMVPSVITPFVVFFLIGIWHGASWQNIAFGLYNATIVAASVALDPVFKKGLKAFRINEESFAWKVFRIVRTFLVLGVSKILVKAPGLTAAWRIIVKIFTDFSYKFDWTMGLGGKNLLLLMMALSLLFVVGVMQEKGIKLRQRIAAMPLPVRWCVYLGLLVIVLVFGIYGPAYDAADFIYQAY